MATNSYAAYAGSIESPQIFPFIKYPTTGRADVGCHLATETGYAKCGIYGPNYFGTLIWFRLRERRKAYQSKY